MPFIRLIARVSFDTAAHRNAAVTQVVNAGGFATAGPDVQGRPALRADMNLAADRTKAEAIRQKIRDAVAAGYIVGGVFHLHVCRHGEPGAGSCRDASFEVG